MRQERFTTMLKNDSGKISASAALVVFIIGVVAIVGAAVLLIVRPGLNKSDGTVQADVIPFAARVDRLDGDIGIARQTDVQQGEADQSSYQGWTKATVNAPVSLGDRIYASDGSKAAIEINRNNYVRLNSGTSLDVVSLSEGHTQLALREGACVFDVGALDSEDTYEVGTPNGAVDFTQPGLYQVGIDDGGNTVVSVLNGLAQVAGLEGSCEVSKGQLLTLAAAETAEAIVSDLSPDVAGPMVDDYYSYRYQKDYDGRYSDYRTYESDPNYYGQSYRRSASYQYIPEDAEIAGVEDLDDYGDWQDVPNYGHCWQPRSTSADWAPYRDGYWSDDRTLGLTWVSNERWGWAPYHYGRWAHVNQQWYWVPAEIKRHAVYSPALVAFVSPRADEVGWVPLGPGDSYVPRYYDRNYQPRYAGSRSEVDRYVNVTNVVNYNDQSAVTVVSINQFTQVITPARVLRPDQDWRRNARPIADPYAVPVVRQIARTLDSSRPAVDVPLESQRRFNRPVMVRRQPVTPATTDVAKALNIEAVPEASAKRKLKTKNIGQAVTATQGNGIPAISPEAKVSQQTPQERDARINALASQAAQGNKAAKREMRQLEAQQQQDVKAQRKAAEQQAAAQQQQQANTQKAEKQAQKQAARQQAQQAAAQAEQQRQAQANPQKAQKQAARQQAQQAAQQSKQAAEQQRQAQAAQQAQQQKAQKQAARQQAQQAAQQAEQQRQAQAAQQVNAQKAQKQAARQQAQQAAQQSKQQAEQQRQAQASQQAQQQKAQKQAARQQAQQQAQQAAQKQAQQEAARQQAQQEQKRIQKQAQQQAAQQSQQQAQQQKQQQKQQRRAEAQPEAQKAQPNAAQPNPAKAEKRAEKAKNKNSNQ